MKVEEKHVYGTFGNINNRTGTSTGNLGFQGKYYDQESGLCYFYYRYYNPRNGRFINEDPIGLSGGLNMYRFVSNNPVKWLDPYGVVTGRPTIQEIYITPEEMQSWGGKPHTGGFTQVLGSPFSNIRPRKCVCRDGKWYPRFHFQLYIRIHLNIATPTKWPHEWRHKSDMLRHYDKIYFKLLEIEITEGYSSEIDCVEAATAWSMKYRYYMKEVIDMSILFRDKLPPFFMFERFF